MEQPLTLDDLKHLPMLDFDEAMNAERSFESAEISRLGHTRHKELEKFTRGKDEMVYVVGLSRSKEVSKGTPLLIYSKSKFSDSGSLSNLIPESPSNTFLSIEL